MLYAAAAHTWAPQRLGWHATSSCLSVFFAGRFEIELGALQAFTNDERTRSFLALEAVAGTAEVRGQATAEMPWARFRAGKLFLSGQTCCLA